MVLQNEPLPLTAVAAVTSVASVMLVWGGARESERPGSGLAPQ